MFERKHFSQGLHCVNKSVIFSRNFLLYTVYTSIYFLKNLISLGFLLKKSLCAGKKAFCVCVTFYNGHVQKQDIQDFLTPLVL